MEKVVWEAAFRYVRAGLAVLPIKPDGSKAPDLTAWKEYQTRLPTEEELERWFGGGKEVGVAILGGRGLEMLDFDQPGLFEEFAELVDAELPGLLARLPVVSTPSGGAHVYYRCEIVEASTKLARPPVGKTLIETRGEGAYVVAPPSPGCCHRTGKPYVQVAGPTLPDIPRITSAERQALHDIARSFNQKPDRVVEEAPRGRHSGLRPGDDFNATATWEEARSPANWTAVCRLAQASGGQPAKTKRRSPTPAPTDLPPLVERVRMAKK